MFLRPTISIVFPHNTRVETEIFSPSTPNLFSNVLSKQPDIQIGERILCETIKNHQWYGHRIDFLLERINDGWQPYIVEYDVSRDSPLK